MVREFLGNEPVIAGDHLGVEPDGERQVHRVVYGDACPERHGERVLGSRLRVRNRFNGDLRQVRYQLMRR